MSVKIDEIFYLRLLFVNVSKTTSFENLRTIKVQIEKVEKNEMK